MKKMNFTTLLSRCFAVMLPMFLLLSSVNVMADNGKNVNKNKTEKSKTNKKAAMVITSTFVGANVVNCPTVDFTLGSATLNVTGVSQLGASVVITVFEAGVPVAANAALSSAITVGTPLVATFGGITSANLTAPNPTTRTFTARVVVQDLLSGGTLEVQELGPIVVSNGVGDLTPPAITGLNAVTIEGCAGIVGITLAQLGQVITDDCSGVNAALTTIVPANVPFNVATAVTVSATDNFGRNSTKVVTVTIRDNTAPVITTTLNGVVRTCNPAAPVVLTVDPITGLTAPITLTSTANDNCLGALGASTQTAGPAAGATLAPGTYTITHTITAGGLTTVCSITVNVVIVQACVEKVSKVIQTAGCLIQLFYSDLVAPGATLPSGIVTIRKPNVLLHRGLLPFTLASPFVQGGDELEVMHTLPDGSMCVTYVRLIDVNAPTVQPLVPIINATIRCTELDINGKAPIPGAIIFGNSLTSTRMPEPISGDNSVAMIPVATLTNPIWATTPAGATPARRVFGVIDCSFFYVSYEDILQSAFLCNGAVIPTSIIRRFRFKDRFGNENFAGQIITVIRPAIQFPAIAVNRTDCSASVASMGLPFIDWNRNGVKNDGEEILPDTDYCGRRVTLSSQTQMELCPGSIMVMREWKIFDCGSFLPFSQNFNLQDQTGPQAVVSYKDNSRVPEVMCTLMVRELADGRMDTLPMQSFVYKTVQENITRTIRAADAERIIKITPLVRLESCNPLIGDIDFTLTPSDPTCSNGKVSVFANVGNVSFDGMQTMSVAGGTTIRVRGRFASNVMGSFDHSFTIFMVDPCGNTTTIKVIVVLVDNIGPNVICEDKEVSLNTAGEAFVTSGMFLGGSSDNCPFAGSQLLIKRKGAACYGDRVILTCNNRGFDSVDVRFVDMMGNYTDCCVRINVRDKFAPTCPMSPDITTVCTDPLLQNVNALFTQPIPYDNCETPRVRSEPVTLALSCGAGEVVKTWVFTDSYGNSVSCNQRLVVTAILGYGVRTLASETVACLPTESDDRAAILRSILHRRSAADNTATCSAPVLKITEMVHSSTEFCKRIMRTYELIDLCNTTGGAALNLGEVTAAIGASTVYAPASGIITWSRTITVIDRTPPTVRVEPEQELCVTDNSCAANFPTITLSATDACAAINIPPGGTTTPNSYSYLYYRYEVRRGSLTGSVITSAAGNGLLTTAPNGFLVTATADNNLRNLPLGVYFLLYVVVDDCGNVAQGTPIRVTIKDCKSPFINTHDKNTALAYVSGNGGIGQGMSQVCISDVLNSVNDNCTPFTTLAGAIATYGMKMERADRALTGVNGTDYRNAPNTQCIMFGCSDLALSPIAVRIWAIDGAGNAVFNIAFITIEDNNRACSAPAPQSIVTGTLKTESAQAAKAVTLSASANGTIANTATTDANGSFSFNVNQTGNYVVKAAKSLTDDKYAGVTTFDIARISKHLLDIEAFTSPYQHIAADVDKNGSVDGADMLHIRNFILRKTPSLPGGVWRFIDKNYTFRNPSNPFGEDFAEVVNVANAKANESVNFVAAKLGDVNGTYSANLVSTVVRNSNALTLNVEDMNLVAGNEYTVNVKSENFNATSFQGTFGIANASIKSVKASGDLKNYSDGNFGIFASEITTSWNGQAKGATQVFSVTFTANKSGKLSDVMTVGNALTPAVANDATGAEMNINLKFSTGKVAGGEFALYQNTPNPVAHETSIGFNMPKDGAAKLTIYSVEGKVVMTKNIDAKAGVNQIAINKSDLTSGVLYYRLETADHSGTKKMIVIE